MLQHRLKSECPRLRDIYTIAVEVLFHGDSDPCDNRVACHFVEKLFAHFFSRYRRGYNVEDAEWFLVLANEQEHWKAVSGDATLEIDVQPKHPDADKKFKVVSLLTQ